MTGACHLATGFRSFFFDTGRMSFPNPQRQLTSLTVGTITERIVGIASGPCLYSLHDGDWKSPLVRECLRQVSLHQEYEAHEPSNKGF